LSELSETAQSLLSLNQSLSLSGQTNCESSSAGSTASDSSDSIGQARALRVGGQVSQTPMD
jgi:hypothetical protein